MIEEKQQVFNEFMDAFVKLDYSKKNKEIIEKLKRILSFLIQYANNHNIPYYVMKNKEINDITDKEGTNEDYLEAVMVYTENIEELLGIIIKYLN